MESRKEREKEKKMSGFLEATKEKPTLHLKASGDHKKRQVYFQFCSQLCCLTQWEGKEGQRSSFNLCCLFSLRLYESRPPSYSSHTEVLDQCPPSPH